MKNEPLAHKLRPKLLTEVIGQKHLVSEGSVLSNLVKNKRLVSMILHGQPGIGKTSIAEVLVNEIDERFRKLNAVINNKKDFDTVISEAKMYGHLIVIMDEIHRLNKDKQDLLLPHLETGLITLIGLTTSNPYHSINPAIRSRCQIFELKPLDTTDIITALNNAISSEYLVGILIDEVVINKIASNAHGDLRYALNLLEVAYLTSNNHHITIEHLDNIAPRANFFHDKNDDGHYNTLSAFQKSIRGSDVDAALHYLARLLESGDLESVMRRMIVIAYEDIGISNPQVGPRVIAACEAAEIVGMPEARIPLSVMVVDLALSPKSNTAYKALDEASSDIRNGHIGEIPINIKDKPIGYKYPHDYNGGWVKQQYLPDSLKNKQYYKPKETGKYERALKERYELLTNLNKK